MGPGETVALVVEGKDPAAPERLRQRLRDTLDRVNRERRRQELAPIRARVVQPAENELAVVPYSRAAGTAPAPVFPPAAGMPKEPARGQAGAAGYRTRRKAKAADFIHHFFSLVSARILVNCLLNENVNMIRIIFPSAAPLVPSLR